MGHDRSVKRSARRPHNPQPARDGEFRDRRQPGEPNQAGDPGRSSSLVARVASQARVAGLSPIAWLLDDMLVQGGGPLAERVAEPVRAHAIAGNDGQRKIISHL